MEHDEHGRDSESADVSPRVDAAAAASLLRSGQQIGAKVYQSVDFRTQALVQAGIAAAMLAYLATFLILFGGEGAAPTGSGANDTGILLIPFLALGQLSIGVRERLRVTLPTHRPRLTLVLGLLSVVPFGAVVVGQIAGQHYPWWLLLIVAVCPAIQPAALAILSVRRMRGGDVRLLPPAPRVPLSGAAQLVTVGLGILCGFTTAFNGSDWRHIAQLLAMMVLLVMLALYRTRWGLASVGSEWGRAQWLGFGSSFVLLLATAVLLARSPFDSLLVGAIGGILVALPLVFSAFRGSHIREYPEEFWDASAPQP